MLGHGHVHARSNATVARPSSQLHHRVGCGGTPGFISLWCLHQVMPTAYTYCKETSHPPPASQGVFHRLTVKIPLASEAGLHRSSQANVSSHKAQVLLGPPQSAAHPSTLLRCCQEALGAVGEGRAGRGQPGEHMDTLPTSPSPSQPAGPPCQLLSEAPAVEQHSSVKRGSPPSTAARPKGVCV